MGTQRQIKDKIIMDETYISFYLKAGRIHVFVDSLRAIDSPNRICFMIDKGGNNLLMKPYTKRDFRSHRVPATVYKGQSSLEISSMRLCNLIAQNKGWTSVSSYRIPGSISKANNVVIFDLNSAIKIKNRS